MANYDRTMLDLRASVPDHVLFQEVNGSAALLNMETETYFSLDDVGTHMWQALADSPTVAAAALRVADVYDAPLETIEADLVQLVAKLRDRKLIETVAA